MSIDEPSIVRDSIISPFMSLDAEQNILSIHENVVATTSVCSVAPFGVNIQISAVLSGVSRWSVSRVKRDMMQ